MKYKNYINFYSLLMFLIINIYLYCIFNLKKIERLIYMRNVDGFLTRKNLLNLCFLMDVIRRVCGQTLGLGLSIL